MAAERLTRIAIVNEDRCKPEKCRQECKKSCPVVKTGRLCIEVSPASKFAFISEELCIGCGICVKKCPFDAIGIINLPKDLEKDTTHRYGPNTFKLQRQMNSSGVAAATRPPPFDGSHYKRWRTRAVLWFQNLNCYSATLGKPEGELTAAQQEAFEKVDAMFKGSLFSVLGDNIVDPYMIFDNGKDAWDALEAKFGVSDAGTELYVMEQLYDYKMTDKRSVVQQAHEIQSLAKELEQFKCTLPDRFVAGGIIAKLPSSWRNFATFLKHKRQEFSVSDLIGSFHVEEKARAKDTRARCFEGGSSANLVQKKNFQSHKFENKNKSDGKCKFDGKNKASHSTNFKKKFDKKKGACHVCGDTGHWAPYCPNRYDKRGNGGKTANVVIGGDTEMKDVGSQGIPPC